MRKQVTITVEIAIEDDIHCYYGCEFLDPVWNYCSLFRCSIAMVEIGETMIYEWQRCHKCIATDQS